MSNPDRIELHKSGSIACTGKAAVNIYRMLTLQQGLRMEIKGMRLCRGRTCYAIIKSEYGLKGRRQRVLDQFEVLVAEASAKVPRVQVD